MQKITYDGHDKTNVKRKRGVLSGKQQRKGQQEMFDYFGKKEGNTS